MLKQKTRRAILSDGVFITAISFSFLCRGVPFFLL
jgi:hypothetical protein